MTNESILRAKYGAEPIALAMVLGSGLSHLIDAIEGEATPYSALHGFPDGGVSGHAPSLKIGKLEGQRVMILGGRQHYYEHGQADAMREAIRTIKAMGAQRLLLTNAAGSLDPAMPPGSIMCLSDHLNMAGANPLIGEPTDARFVPLINAYSPAMRQALKTCAKSENIDWFEGVYCWWSGPSFETPAEIRMLQMLGGNAVGMSTVPEVILARFFGLEVAAISVITNMGSGLSEEKISHEHTKEMAPLGAAKLEKLLRSYLKSLPQS